MTLVEIAEIVLNPPLYVTRTPGKTRPFAYPIHVNFDFVYYFDY